MAHFAKISEENVVLLVTPVDNKDLLDENKVEQESLGQAYLEKHSNWPAHLWIKTSYNTKNNTHTLDGTPFRGNYAGIGFTYDEVNDVFYNQSPYPSWILNDNWIWEAPVSMPDDGNRYTWNEETTSWDLVE